MPIHRPCSNVVGTADYLSPDFAKAWLSKCGTIVTGVDAQCSSDFWALGCIAFECATGASRAAKHPCQIG
jgi:serine/threonine protein kinase